MKTFYHSESISWTSHPKKGKEFGKRNVVTIKNGKGKKTEAVLNSKGEIKSKKTVKLNKKEIKNVLNRNFIPGFWNNCAIRGDCKIPDSLSNMKKSQEIH